MKVVKLQDMHVPYYIKQIKRFKKKKKAIPENSSITGFQILKHILWNKPQDSGTVTKDT